MEEMMSYTHTEGCQKLAIEQESEHADWVAKWPKFCRKCHGWGGKPCRSWDGESVDLDPCEACTEAGVCARCGEPSLTSESRGDDSTGEGPCKSCSWDYDDGEPEVAGCICGAGDEDY
jgi:hypothetical protein